MLGKLNGAIQDFFLIASAGFSLFYLARYVLDRIDDASVDRERARRKSAATAILRRLNASQVDAPEADGDAEQGARVKAKKEDLVLNSYEETIALDVVAADDIPVSFDDIGGLDDIIDELKESVIFPLTMPHLYSQSSSLLSAPSGVLLYGPPGCGKTMMAKALAHESGATFINLHISTLTEKWYGDSNKMVNAMFSLARKLQPSIVFIDEIDAVLGTRRSGEHEASGMVKAEFMTHWDGLASANSAGESQRILILGATNRIQDIDEAILRRMPKKFSVTLPSLPQRARILSLILKDTKLDDAAFDLDRLVRELAGMSGSEIKEACRDAAMIPVRELIRRKRSEGTKMTAVRPEDVRGLRTVDFFEAMGGTKSKSKPEVLDNRDINIRDDVDS